MASNLVDNKGYLQPTAVRNTNRLSLLPLNQEVELIRADSLDEWGQPIPGSGGKEIYRCKINYYDNRFFLRQTLGYEVERTVMIHFRGTVSLRVDDIIRWYSPKGDIVDFHPMQIFYTADLAGIPFQTKVLAK